MCNPIILPHYLNTKLNQIIVAYLMLTLFLDPARIVFENINKCKEAIALDVEVNKVMMTNLADKSSLFNTEDSSIKLAASDVVDGFFYCSVIKFRDETQFVSIDFLSMVHSTTIVIVSW